MKQKPFLGTFYATRKNIVTGSPHILLQVNPLPSVSTRSVNCLCSVFSYPSPKSIDIKYNQIDGNHPSPTYYNIATAYMSGINKYTAAANVGNLPGMHCMVLYYN